MKIPLHHVDAFTNRVFHGNPATVCPLASWLADATLQSIAAENNLSETAFVVGGGGGYEIRWFTPVTEVDLCGHATLAAAFVLFRADAGLTEIRFSSRSGPLRVARDGDLLVLDFPAREPTPCAAPPELTEGLRRRPIETLVAHAYLAVYGSEEEVVALDPDMARIASLKRTVIVTAPGRSSDFVSRYFAPGKGVPEDPVTGSAHCTLTPYWAKRLGKRSLHARQVSRRGGELFCEQWGDRVLISGRAAKYLEGVIEVPAANAPSSPWLSIPAADYEGHMGPDGADQLAPLAAVFADVYSAVRPSSLAILGCATGNGLSAVDPGTTRRVVGVDINQEYVELARRRYAGLGAALDLRCAELLTCELEAGAFDLIHAALIFEHVDAAALAARIARWLAPGGTCSVVLQLQRGEDRPAVSTTRFASLQTLASSMRLLTPGEARRLLALHGLGEKRSWEVPLRDGKAFYVGLFNRAR